MSSNQAQDRCRDCRNLSTRTDIWICVPCHWPWCDNCWDKVPVHNPSIDGKPLDINVTGVHEKVSKEVFARLKPILAPLALYRKKNRNAPERLSRESNGLVSLVARAISCISRAPTDSSIS
ncbi:hypothetical protein QBC38DRAFT_480364 [Podospora fimiseda]|uniref:Uncharacterized protein n=1 Tax=Podospora fimiseda TaxID=252190 RepID=A0AAN7BNH7_9PEZI|nr:hypothetical protein QBC38DRAFT_480364 [Podospora fimiseda]